MKRSFRFGALAMALLMAVLLMPTLSYADEGGIEGMPEELTIFAAVNEQFNLMIVSGDLPDISKRGFLSILDR